MVNHAPYSIVGEIVIVYGKTTKTACGKRVLSSKLVKRADTDCPDCCKQIEADIKRDTEIKVAAKDLGLNIDPYEPAKELWL
jgi:hypothetical protein